MAESIRGMLPPVLQPLVSDFFDRAKPNETRATCDKCAMCDKGDPSPVPMEYFDEGLKCCTYFPQLPNYLVGAILADPNADMEEGKRRIRERIKTRIGVTPHWLTRPNKMTHIMQGYGMAFGRAKTLLCPYFDSNNLGASCTIWRHRETICMTYYCKYIGGQRGYDFWTGLKGYLGHVQRKCVRGAQLAVDPDVIEPGTKKNQLSAEDIDDLPPKPADYAKWWGPWLGREEDFYIACYEWMKNRKREEFLANVDETDEGKFYVKEVTTTLEKLESKILPKNLIRNVRMKEDHVGEKVVVTTYHRFDSFALDKDLYDVVGSFKATDTLDENLARLAKEGIELAPELIEYLFAAGVLVEPVTTKPAETKSADAVKAELAGRRAALDAILEARGITADVEQRRKMAAADGPTIDEWIKKAATSASIVEVLGVDPTAEAPKEEL